MLRTDTQPGEKIKCINQGRQMKVTIGKEYEVVEVKTKRFGGGSKKEFKILTDTGGKRWIHEGTGDFVNSTPAPAKTYQTMSFSDIVALRNFCKETLLQDGISENTRKACKGIFAKATEELLIRVRELDGSTH